MHSAPLDIVMAVTVTFILDILNFTILNSRLFILNASLKQNLSLMTLERLLISQKLINEII